MIQFAYTLEQIRVARARYTNTAAGEDLNVLAGGTAARIREELPAVPAELAGAVALVLAAHLGEVGKQGVHWSVLLLAAQWAAADLITAGTADPWPPQPGEVWGDMRGDRWTSIPGRPGELMRITGTPHPSGLPERGPADEVARRYGPVARLLAAPTGGGVP